MTAATEPITVWAVTIPMALCGLELSKNGRVHWSARHRAFQAQKDYVLWVWKSEGPTDQVLPWPSAIMSVCWRYSRGRHPDDDNAVARLAPCRDAFQAIGLVRDDADVRIGEVRFVKVTGAGSVTVMLRRGD